MGRSGGASESITGLLPHPFITAFLEELSTPRFKGLDQAHEVLDTFNTTHVLPQETIKNGN